jgi:hypothetical protein
MSISTSVLCDPPDSSAPLAVLVVGERDTKPDPSALVDASTCSVSARTWDMAIDLRLRCIPQATRLAMDSTPRVCAFGGTSKRKDCPRCPEFGSSLAVAIIGPELGLENPDKKWRRGWQPVLKPRSRWMWMERRDLFCLCEQHADDLADALKLSAIAYNILTLKRKSVYL